MLAVSLGAWRPGLVRAATVLRVLAWPGYADPDLVAVFEKRHGVKVEITTVASDDVLRAKLASPDGPGFDLVAASDAEPRSGAANAGHVHVHFGGTSKLTDMGDVVILGAQGGDRAGAALAITKLDGDDAQDLIIGAPGAFATTGGIHPSLSVRPSAARISSVSRSPLGTP